MQERREEPSGFSDFDEAYRYLEGLQGRSWVTSKGKRLSIILRDAPPGQQDTQDLIINALSGNYEEEYRVRYPSGLIYSKVSPCITADTLLGEVTMNVEGTIEKDYLDPRLSSEENYATRIKKAIELAENIMHAQ